jgi:hypothetical protein
VDITINNTTIPSDWEKKSHNFSYLYKGRNHSLLSNYRPISLTSVVYKKMEHVIASYLRKILDKEVWLFKGQHGFRLEFSCENHIIEVCQDLADSLDNRGKIHNIIIDFSQVFDLVSHDRLLTKIAVLGVNPKVVV